MKKILLLAVVAVVAMTSCKKDYTCECLDTDRTDPMDLSYTYKKVKKKDAEKSCEAQNTAAAGLWTCKLK